MLNFIFIEVTWKLDYLWRLNFEQEKWLRRHTLCLHAKWLRCFNKRFPKNYLLNPKTHSLNSIFSWYWWSFFFCFLVKHWNKFFQHIYAAYQSKLCLKKNRLKHKNYAIKIVGMAFLLPHCKDTDHGVKIGQNLVFYFCYYLCTRVDLICLACLTFPKFLWWTASTFWA